MEISLNNSIKCQICYQYFSSERLPLVLACGHTICATCVKKIYQVENSICPFDKRPMIYDKFESIPVNYSFKEIIQALINSGIVTDCKFERTRSFNNNEEEKIITFEKINKQENILEFIRDDYKIFNEIETIYKEFKTKFKKKVIRKK